MFGRASSAVSDYLGGPMRGFGRQFFTGLLVLATVALPEAAYADAPSTSTSPTGKGIVGGGLLGAEAVMLTEAAASVRPGWAYAVGGGLGAVAGAVGGHFAETDGSARLSLYLLVGGMALALPTTVAVLSTTSYEPVNYVEDRPPADEPVAEPVQGAPTAPPPASEPAAAPAAAPPPAGPPPAEAPSPTAPTSQRVIHHTGAIAKAPKLAPALVGLGSGALTLSVPAVEVRQMYTKTEVATLGVKQQTEVAVPVLNVVF
jgi:hypothetical protein